MKQPRLKPRDKDTIIQALNAGVVPRLGLQHVQVGRAGEVQALVQDIERIVDGGAAFRLVIGEYGSGKTFFLNLIRLVALERKLVVASADLGPDRRLHATGGQARSLYAELTRNLSTRTKPNGGALASIVERFVAETHKSAKAAGRSVEDEIDERLAPLQDLVSGYDFTSAVVAYWRASDAADDEQRAAALRWLRGEFGTKTEARQALNVRSIIDDSNIYDYLKLMAQFVRIAGYGGLMVTVDEMVNLYKLQSTQARGANFEQLLRMLNDVLQGNNGHLGFIFGGTPEFLMDTRRGLYSYEALQSRLAENRFATDGLVDMSGPVIRLQSLTQEELFVLLGRIRSIFALGDSTAYLVPDEAFAAFMEHCSKRIGEAYFRTPRTTVKAFVNLLSVIEQNPGAQWQDLLDHIEIEHDDPGDELAETSSEDDELTSFKL